MQMVTGQSLADAQLTDRLLHRLDVFNGTRGGLMGGGAGSAGGTEGSRGGVSVGGGVMPLSVERALAEEAPPLRDDLRIPLTW
jgi:hypothetical protein